MCIKTLVAPSRQESLHSLAVIPKQFLSRSLPFNGGKTRRITSNDASHPAAVQLIELKAAENLLKFAYKL
jgi:hypothetical protein